MHRIQLTEYLIANAELQLVELLPQTWPVVVRGVLGDAVRAKGALELKRVVELQLEVLDKLDVLVGEAVASEVSPLFACTAQNRCLLGLCSIRGINGLRAALEGLLNLIVLVAFEARAKIKGGRFGVGLLVVLDVLGVTDGTLEAFRAEPRPGLLLARLLRIVGLLEAIGVVAVVALAAELQLVRLIADLAVFTGRTGPVEQYARSTRPLVLLQAEIMVRLAANVTIDELDKKSILKLYQDEKMLILYFYLIVLASVVVVVRAA
jgi:hypothetical protein